MKALAAEHLAFLSQFGFEPERLEAWRAGVRSGALSTAGNQVRGDLLAPKPDQIRDLPPPGSKAREALAVLGKRAIADGRLGVVILNGGMATRFGGVVKGTVEVLPGESFLALRIGDVLRQQQLCGGRIPVLLMNSFATDEATRAHCAEHDDFGLAPGQLTHFTQFVSVRLDGKGDVFTDGAGEISPYGPGHGDFSFALRKSGALQRFLAGGGRYLMLSNVDNLGARVLPAMLGQHLEAGAQVTVETTPKEQGDVGGSPFVVDGKLQLVEQLRYPPGFDPGIVDVFNTNTFWFDAEALDRDFDLGWYYTEKKVDGKKAVQIERLVGELTRFLTASFVRVPRAGVASRFVPLKTPEDLDASRAQIAAMYAQ